MKLVEILHKVGKGEIAPGTVLKSIEGATVYILSLDLFFVIIPDGKAFYCQRTILSREYPRASL